MPRPRWTGPGGGGVAVPLLWLLAAAAEAAAGALVVWGLGRHGPAALAVTVNLLVAGRFAVTLRAGADPLITRYARFDPGGLPPGCEGYTRGLTALWAAVLVLFAAIHAGALAGAWTTGQVSAVESAVVLALFVGEHPVRMRLFPGIGRMTPWRTLRAMWVSMGARHAA